MKLKLDENVSASTAPRLAILGFDVDTVLSEGLQGRSDVDVWAAAQAEGRLLVTQDLDFSDARVIAAGTHAGIFLVRLPDAEQWRLADYLVGGFSGPDAVTWSGCGGHAEQGPRAPAYELRVPRGAVGAALDGEGAVSDPPPDSFGFPASPSGHGLVEIDVPAAKPPANDLCAPHNTKFSRFARALPDSRAPTRCDRASSL